MRNFLLLMFAALVMAMLLSSTFKKNTTQTVMPEVYAKCYPADVRDLSEQEAATNAFAMLHEEPLAFIQMEQFSGHRVILHTNRMMLQTCLLLSAKPDRKTM